MTNPKPWPGALDPAPPPHPLDNEPTRPNSVPPPDPGDRDVKALSNLAKLAKHRIQSMALPEPEKSNGKDQPKDLECDERTRYLTWAATILHGELRGPPDLKRVGESVDGAEAIWNEVMGRQK